jgi:anti-sigma B factor antagonist
MLSYSGHECDGVLVLTVEEGEPGEGTAAQREWLYKAIEGRAEGRFIINLDAVRYMSSSDVGVLLTLKRRIDAHKGKLALANVNPFVFDVFRAMRLDRLFTITPDMPSAFEAVAGG